MKSLLELEKELDLSEYERDLGRKRTKAGKYYWLCALITYVSYVKREKPVNWEPLCEEYENIFYRHYELVADILEDFDGMPTSEIRQLSLEETKRIFELEFKKQRNGLEKNIQHWLVNHQVYFDNIEPENSDFYNLDFLDNRHSELPLISDCFKRLLDAAGHQYVGNSLMINRKWKLKPTTVKKSFSNVMDKVIKVELMYWISDYLKAYLDTSHEVFRTKEKTDGPTDALYKLLTLTPQAVDWTDKKLKYHLMFKYCKSNGDRFKKKELQKPVKRFRDE